MKKQLVIIIIVSFCEPKLLNSYQPLEPDGLMGVLTAKTPVYLAKNKSIRIEKRNNGTMTSVRRINGREEFERAVIMSSLQKPVVVLAFSEGSADTAKMRQVYQDVADTFKGQVQFVSMDLLALRHGTSENHELIGHIMSMQNITRLQLPIVFFFKDGDLYAPEHESAIMLQGLYSKEHLAVFIHNKFFAAEGPIIDSSVQDLTRTPLAADRLSDSAPDGNKQPDEKLSLGQRFLNFFKRK